MATKAERLANLIRLYKARTSVHFKVLEEQVLHTSVECRRHPTLDHYYVILPGVEAIFDRGEADPFWRLNSFSFAMFDHMSNEIRYDTIQAGYHEEPYWYWTEPHIKDISKVLEMDTNLPNYQAFLMKERRQTSPQSIYSGIRWEGQVKPRKKYRMFTLQQQLRDQLNKRGISDELLQLETVAKVTTVDPFDSAFM